MQALELRSKKVLIKNFIMQIVFRDGFLRTTGTDFEKILPPVSRFGGGGDHEKKKQTVIDKLKDISVSAVRQSLQKNQNNSNQPH